MLREVSLPDNQAGRVAFRPVSLRAAPAPRRRGYGGSGAAEGPAELDRGVRASPLKARSPSHGSPLGRIVLADQGQDKRAAVGRGAMLEKENPLPCAELHPSVGEWDAQLRLGQRALDVGRHIVRPLVVVAVE